MLDRRDNLTSSKFRIAAPESRRRRDRIRLEQPLQVSVKVGQLFFLTRGDALAIDDLRWKTAEIDALGPPILKQGRSVLAQSSIAEDHRFRVCFCDALANHLSKMLIDFTRGRRRVHVDAIHHPDACCFKIDRLNLTTVTV